MLHYSTSGKSLLTFYRGGVCVNTLEKLIYCVAFDNYLFRFASFSAHFLLFLVQ